MGTLSTLTILMSLGAWGAATDGGPPSSPPPANPASRTPAPVPPVEYLRAGATLFNNGQYDLATKYLKAAQDYRDQLSADEQSRLNEYLSAMQQVKSGTADSAVTAASAPAQAATETPAQPTGEEFRRGEGGTDPKQQGRWLLRTAREEIRLGNYDEAEAKLAQARSLNVRWGLFDDTPDKVEKLLSEVKPKSAPAAEATAVAAPTPAGSPSDQKSAAKARLKQARDLLGQNQYDQAEAIASEVGGWNLSYGVFEDTPDKVASAARALRRRDAIRSAPPAAQVSQESYDLLVREARALMTQGNFADAEQKAQAALRLNVVPAVSADRAEAVLSELAAMKTGSPTDAQVAPAQAQAPALEAPASLPEPAPMPAPDAPVAQPPVPDVAPEAAPAPVAEAAPGSDMLDQAKALMANGNYAAAKQAAEAAKQGGSAEAADLIAQIDLAAQSTALQLYESALDAVRKGDSGRARALLTEVSAMGAGVDESLAQKVQDLLLKLPLAEGGPAAPAPLNAQDEALALKAQQMNAEVGVKVAEARRLLEVDPAKAIEILEETMAAVKAAELSEPVARTMVRRLEVALELARKDKTSFDTKMADRKFREEIEQKKLRILEADKAKKEQVKALMDKALTADAGGDFAAAESYARRVVEIDPMNLAATALASTARTKRHYNRDKELRSAKDETVLNALQDVDAASVVDADVMNRGISYPKSFDELTRNRSKFRTTESRRTPADMEVERKLNETVDMNMKAQSLGEALDFLRNYTGLNVVVDNRALQDEAITEDSQVTLIANKMKIKKALELMLKQHGLTYRIDEGVLLITTPQSRGKTFVQAYQVADLVMSPKTHKPSTFNTNGMLASQNPQPELTADGAVKPASGEEEGQTFSDRDIDFGPLMQLITTTIAPGTWQVTDPAGNVVSDPGFGLGGGFGNNGLDGADEPPIGSITPFILNISLIIRHTAEVHDDIVDLLRQLRRLQDLQVSVEVRFITVNDDFFEQIGVDFDFSLQSDVYGPKSSFAIPNPAAVFTPPGAGGGGGGGGGGTGTFTAPYLVNPARDHSIPAQGPLVVGVGSNGNTGTPRFSPDLQIPFLNGSADLIAPANARPGAGSTFGLAFLDDLEVYLFLTALQGDSRSNVVQAPKVTSFNGATAFIQDFSLRNLVTSLTPVVNAGAVAYQPQVSQVPDGVALSVTPVVTADRRYVRLTLAPTFQVIQGVDNFTFGGAAVGGGGLGGGAAALQTTIQLPRVANTTVFTTVTVPDGGTVLLGGVKRLTEQRLEFGTPILSKMPGINRLFRNIGIGRTTDSLMLMVTPRIIILEEEEERLGIPVVNPSAP